MKTWVRILGLQSVLLLLFHMAFWHLFRWPVTLAGLEPLHRMLLQTFNLCMLPVFAFSAYAFLAFPSDVTATRPGRALLAMNGSLYLLRAVAELLYGNLQTGRSQFFLGLGFVLACAFAWPLVSGKGRPSAEKPRP